MQNKIKLLGLIAFAALIGFSMTACNNGGGGNDQTISLDESVTYESKADNGVYVLVITPNTGRAAANSIAYTLTFYPSSTGVAKTTSGRVTSITSDRSRIILEAASASASVTITVTINSEDKMIALTWEGKITWEDNTETTAPETLTPVIEDDGLTISSDGVLTRYTGKGENVTIPHRVTSIGAGSFAGCPSLISVTFQGTISSNYFQSSAFPGDLRDKFYATDQANGTPGTYTTTAPISSTSVWTKS